MSTIGPPRKLQRFADMPIAVAGTPSSNTRVPLVAIFGIHRAQARAETIQWRHARFGRHHFGPFVDHHAALSERVIERARKAGHVEQLFDAQVFVSRAPWSAQPHPKTDMI